jgi:predicted ribosomally synthesized peptide with SipW-like signal peptide
MKLLKNKLLVCNILLCVSILLLLGTTIAYFTDRSEFSNTLTAGNVSITLTEAAVKRGDGGHLVEDASKDRIKGTSDAVVHDYGTIFPGQEIFKDPTIKNVGSEDAYIAAKLTVTDGAGDIHKVLGFDGYQGLDITLLLGGGVFDEAIHVGNWNGHQNVWYNDHYAMVQVPNMVEGRYDFYFFFNAALAEDEEALLFDSMIIPAELDNSHLQEFTDFKMTVRAFAVQTGGLENCYDAMTKAFPSYFSFN